MLVVCDLNRFEVHTKFTNAVSTVHEFALDDLEKDPTDETRQIAR